jgi:hypothetical protein
VVLEALAGEGGGEKAGKEGGAGEGGEEEGEGGGDFASAYWTVMDTYVIKGIRPLWLEFV